eukprot:13695240-Alexandrium_andersonii.AAC.1
MRVEHGVYMRRDSVRISAPEAGQVLGAVALAGPRKAHQAKRRREVRQQLKARAWPGVRLLTEEPVDPASK